VSEACIAGRLTRAWCSRVTGEKCLQNEGRIWRTLRGKSSRAAVPVEFVKQINIQEPRSGTMSPMTTVPKSETSRIFSTPPFSPTPLSAITTNSRSSLSYWAAQASEAAKAVALAATQAAAMVRGGARANSDSGSFYMLAQQSARIAVEAASAAGRAYKIAFIKAGSYSGIQASLAAQAALRAAQAALEATMWASEAGVVTPNQELSEPDSN
jgi:hypothetical protein